VGGSAYAGMVQGVNASDGAQYVVVSKYKLALASELPCDRSYAGACATFNAVALTGHMLSSLMVSAQGVCVRAVQCGCAWGAWAECGGV